MNTLFSRVPDPRRELTVEGCDGCSDSDDKEECGAYDRFEPEVGYLASELETGAADFKMHGANYETFLNELRKKVRKEMQASPVTQKPPPVVSLNAVTSERDGVYGRDKPNYLIDGSVSPREFNLRRLWDLLQVTSKEHEAKTQTDFETERDARIRPVDQKGELLKFYYKFATTNYKYTQTTAAIRIGSTQNEKPWKPKMEQIAREAGLGRNELTVPRLLESEDLCHGIFPLLWTHLAQQMGPEKAYEEIDKRRGEWYKSKGTEGKYGWDAGFAYGLDNQTLAKSWKSIAALSDMSKDAMTEVRSAFYAESQKDEHEALREQLRCDWYTDEFEMEDYAKLAELCGTDMAAHLLRIVALRGQTRMMLRRKAEVEQPDAPFKMPEECMLYEACNWRQRFHRIGKELGEVYKCSESTDAVRKIGERVVKDVLSAFTLRLSPEESERRNQKRRERRKQRRREKWEGMSEDERKQFRKDQNEKRKERKKRKPKNEKQKMKDRERRKRKRQREHEARQEKWKGMSEDEKKQHIEDVRREKKERRERQEQRKQEEEQKKKKKPPGTEMNNMLDLLCSLEPEQRAQLGELFKVGGF